jgi:tetratricopeptide (TPR) repeat protein
MKFFLKKFFLLLLVFFVTSGVTISVVGAEKFELKAEKKDEFLRSPAKYLGEIYNDFHFFKIDDGIEKAKRALKIVNELYRKNPEAELEDPSLNWKKIYQLKSVLHTLLGMLYFRKSVDIAAKAEKKELEYLEEVLKKKKKLSEKDIEYLSRLAEEQDKILKNKSKKYATLSIKHFKEAIKVYPDNPYPHFQLAKYYLAAGELELAKKELLKTAESYAKQKDYETLESLVQFVKEQGMQELVRKIKEFVKRQKEKDKLS